jgi:tetratricopeptide (TPR) repeat protein
MIGYESFIEADNIQLALNQLRTQKVDLILCEASMPGISGTEVLKAVRTDEAFQNIPFIMIASDNSSETIAEAGESQVDAYILKPFTPELIKEKINQILQVRRVPSPIDIHLNVGIAHLKSLKYDLALAEFQKAFDINPKSSRVLLAIGHLKEQQGELENAERYYLQAVELTPLFLKAHEALAALYESQGDFLSAAENLRNAATINPRNMDRQLKLGRVLIAAGQKENAHEVFKSVMSLAKDKYSDVVQQVSDDLMLADMVAEAQEMLEEGLSLNPHNINLYNQLGIAYRKQKKFKEAVRNYEQALKIDPENETLYYNLGRAYYEAGDRDKSEEAMRKAIKLYPDFKEASDFLATILNP